MYLDGTSKQLCLIKKYCSSMRVVYKSDAFQLNAVLENISDQRYRTYSSGISAPGRNLIIAANYKF